MRQKNSAEFPELQTTLNFQKDFLGVTRNSFLRQQRHEPILQRSERDSRAMRTVARSEFSQVEPKDFVAARTLASRRLIKIHDPNSGKVKCYVRAELFLTSTSAADFQRLETKTFLNRSSDTGFALTRNGELQNVFTASGNGAGVRAVVHAIALGAVILSAIGEPLVEFYSRLGWLEIDRIAFDPAQAPDRWPYELIGTPPVVSMQFLRAIPLGLSKGQIDDLCV